MYWKLTLLILVSVFQLDHGRAQQGCSNIPNSLRFDCYPEGDANEQSCVNRGCCWAKPTIEEENVHVPLDIPYCFYPNDYGYQVVNKEKTQTGYLLSLTKKGHPGPYGNEIENLAVDVRFETKDRLHFKVWKFNFPTHWAHVVASILLYMWFNFVPVINMSRDLSSNV